MKQRNKPPPPPHHHHQQQHSEQLAKQAKSFAILPSLLSKLIQLRKNCSKSYANRKSIGTGGGGVTDTGVLER